MGCPAVAQDDPAARKQARAVRVRSGEIRVDGRLDEPIWQSAPAVTDFVMAEPVERGQPSDVMDVRFVFDETALYVGAHMVSRVAGAIQAPLTRRDEAGQAEYLQIELDTYLDRRTAYMFGVTAAGVRLDHYHSSDDERNADSGYDPVWEARTAASADGWTAELWIPMSQLRFNDTEELVWGLNIKRWVPTLNEEVYWALVPRTERGWSSRFGDLRGIERVRGGRRLEVLPYVAGDSRINHDRDINDPFDDGRNLEGRAGADLKFGIGPNLTLDATFNPDFGQIDADPAEVNLSAFETFFPERRPFFLEGASLLQGQTNNFFYSRRIGARPTGPASGVYVEYPNAATILGAAKVTGRQPSGLSIGALVAVTDEEWANTMTDGIQAETKVAPPVFWAVTRVQQEFGDQGSEFGVQMTAMRRNLNESDPLADLLTRTAMTGVADTRIRFGDRTYEFSFSGGGSWVAGNEAAISRLQRANTHLFQRPDKPRYDATRTSLSGMQIRTAFEKIAGRHWLWGANTMIESPEFEPNDLGRLNFAGDVQSSARVRYRETVPGRYIRSYSLQLSGNSNSYYDSLTPRASLGVNADATFRNFWSAGASVNRNFRGQDAQLTRGGPSMGSVHGWSVSWNLRNSNASTTQWSIGGFYRTSELGEYVWDPGFSLSMRPSPSWRISFNPNVSRERSLRQYFSTLDGPREEVYFKRYIFGFIERTTISMQIRVNYVFKPDLTLDVYAEPFAASGRYTGFGELSTPRSHYLREYGAEGIELERLDDGRWVVQDGADTFTLPNRDFNSQSYRSNVVLRWEWRPGSILYAVWQQDRASTVSSAESVNVGDAFGSITAPGDNIFAIKSTFWFGW
jgi:hypothetical protein